MRCFIMLILALLLGCGGSDPLGPEDFNINGRWTGSLDGAAFAMSITETSNNVSGTATLMGILALNVTGTRAGASVSMHMTAVGFAPIDATCQIQTATLMTCSVYGSGYTGTPVSFTKG